MPIININVGKLRSAEEKRALAKEAAELIGEISSTPLKAIRVYVDERDEDSFYNPAPSVLVEWAKLDNRTAEVKSKISKQVGEKIAKAAGCAEDEVVFLFNDYTLNNIVLAGVAKG